MKKGILFLFASILVSVASVNAQTYQTALGAKFYAGNGSVGGINIRHSLKENAAVEGSLLFFNGGGLGIEGLYEYQGPVNGAEGLQYFVGGGGVIGFGGGARYYDHNNSVSFALRLTGGLDYKITNVPIDVSLSLDPFFYLAPSTGAYLPLGIGFRYVIK